MEELSWEICRARVDQWSAEAEPHLNAAASYIRRYRVVNDDPEQLSQLLAELNYRVLELGDLQAKVKRIELWTEQRYKVEKGLATVALIKSGKPVGYAKEAKYADVESYLDIMVDAGAMHMRLQNGRSSARDTTEAIRSRISQIKGAIRSS